jgi:hypothetical protein
MEASHFAIIVGGLLAVTSFFLYLSRLTKAASTDEEFERMKVEVRKSHEVLHQSQTIWLDHKVELEKEIEKLMKQAQAYRTGYETEFKAHAKAVEQLTAKPKKKKVRNG